MKTQEGISREERRQCEGQEVPVHNREDRQFEVIARSCSTEVTEIFKHQTALF
jgi:hypothetical protein